MWLAEDTVMDRLVALKLLRAEYSDSETFRLRLFREARAAGRLHEPHVVPIHGCGEIDGQLYIDMRLIDGVDLEAVLSQQAPLAPARAVAVVRQIAAALDAAHNAGLTHRDVKPANILLLDDDFACLLDFGLASAASDAKLTSTGFTIGTFAYMAPERLSADAEIDGRADVYALACVLYECLTGSRPYSGDTPALVSAHLTAPIPKPSQHGPNVPAALDDVITRGMAKNPADRYGSAGDLARAAQSALAIEQRMQPDTIAASVAAIPLASAPVADPVDGIGLAAIHSARDMANTVVAPTARAAVGPSTALATDGSPGASRTSIRNRGNIILVATILVLITIAGTVSAVVMQPRSTGTSAPVTDTALEGLLLTTEQVNVAMSTTDMKLAVASDRMDSSRNTVMPQSCLSLGGAADASVYGGSGNTATRERVMQDPGTYTHFADEAVTLYPTAEQAQLFFASSARQWPTCHSFTQSVNSSNFEWSVGQVSDTNGILSTTSNRQDLGAPIWACQRALAVSNNVVVDITTCSADPGNSAVNIAQQIAAKVPA
ncbi:serine/threonine-protein kinase PknH/PknJ [Mycobacterium simiae]|uniref:serine/threonine-protein kinase PknH/PknJ n=1 Tax=Mycobacterium simiae TaxID=1784 RepID=UPI0026E05541|nr:sensor domain-containing protein [Mycobacterium simiae]